jgi:glyoxylase-like metal-dependent hydrolase (beta-lactamase superfamily II)
MNYVWTFNFNQTEVTVMTEGVGAVPMDVILDGVPSTLWRQAVQTDDEDRLLIDYNLVHVALPGASILVDTGFGEYGPTDPMVELSPGATAGLAERGVRPVDITHVLISHMHSDHVAGATKSSDRQRVPAFPKARYYVMQDEWESAPEWWQPAEAVELQKKALHRAGVVEFVRGEREIVPGVRYIPAPGESPGHAIVRVEASGEILYYLGDLFHIPAEFSHPEWGPPHRDRTLLTNTRKRFLRRFAEENAWLITTHLRFPGIGKVERIGEGFRWMERYPTGKPTLHVSQRYRRVPYR